MPARSLQRKRLLEAAHFQPGSSESNIKYDGACRLFSMEDNIQIQDIFHDVVAQKSKECTSRGITLAFVISHIKRNGGTGLLSAYTKQQLAGRVRSLIRKAIRNSQK